MRYKLLSIKPEIVDASTYEESNYIIKSTMIQYVVIISLEPYFGMEVSVELPGYPTLGEIKNFIRQEHDHPSLTK
jgi:hypothetical protein